MYLTIFLTLVERLSLKVEKMNTHLVSLVLQIVVYHCCPLKGGNPFEITCQLIVAGNDVFHGVIVCFVFSIGFWLLMMVVILYVIDC